MKKILIMLLAAVLAMVVVLGGQWYMYVNNTESPYDEVGIAITQYLPAPIRAWGCGKLEATFAGALPPMGCSSEDGRQWI